MSVCLSYFGSSFGQSSPFEEVRQWSDQTAKFSVEATIVSCNSKQVKLERRNSDGTRKTVKLPLAKLADDDQKFARNFASFKLQKLKRAEKTSAIAKDTLTQFKRFVEDGFVDDSNRLFVESRIEALEKHAAYDAILVGSNFVSPDDFEKLRASSSERVATWIGEKDVETSKQLRRIFLDDPSCLSAAILLAMYYDVFKGDAAAAEKVLTNAVREGQRYSAVANQADEHNYHVAINNLAVATVRQGHVSKASRFWEELSTEENAELTPVVRSNVARVASMLQSDQSGLQANSSTKRKFLEFNASLEKEMENLSENGWMMLCPLDAQLQPLSDLGFLISHPKFQIIAGQIISDRRCVQCRGTNRRNCPNKTCVKGAIKKVRLERTYDDRGFYTGDRVAEIRHDPCPTCGGSSKVSCPCCNSGSQ